MYIHLVHWGFVSSKEAGGTRHYELARGLIERGHHVTIIGSPVNYLTGAWIQPQQSGWNSQEIVDGIVVWRAFTYYHVHKGYLGRMIGFLSFVPNAFLCGLKVQRPDIIIGTTPQPLQALVAWSLARIRNIPFVLEVRDLWPEFAVDIGVLRNKAAIRLAYQLMNLLYQRSSRIIVNSPGFISTLARNYHVPEHCISLIPNGVEVSDFNPLADDGQIRQRHGWVDKFVVLYTGAHGPANDLATVLDAAFLLREYMDIQVVLVGDGKDKPALMQSAGLRGLTNVSFLPACSKSEIPRYLAAVDACLAILKNTPMLRTTYPNKVFDYMAAGRPIVLAIDGVIREVVELADGGVFAQPGKPEALASAILQLYKRPDRGRSLGANARRYVETHFNRQYQVEQLEKLLTEVVGELYPGR